MKKVFCVIISVILLFAVVGCKEKSDGPTMNIDFIENENGEKVTVRNGQAQEFFNVSADKAQTVKVSVKKESGELHIKIYNVNDENDIIYEGHDFPAESFTVNVKKEGRYIIFVTCTDFVGEYKFTYDLNI